MIGWILHEPRQMLRLQQDRIEIGIGEAQAKFNVLGARQMLVGLEFFARLFGHKLAPIGSRHLFRTPQKQSVKRQCSRTRCWSGHGSRVMVLVLQVLALLIISCAALSLAIPR